MEHFERPHDFSEVLAEQIRRAPYVIASLLAHFCIFLLVAGVMLLRKTETEVPVLVAAPPPPPPEVDEPEEPIKPEVLPEAPVEPVVVDTPVVDPIDDQNTEITGDVDFDANAPFDSDSMNADIGLGPGAGGLEGRPGGPGDGGSPKSELAVRHALQWLADHQTVEGRWDADEFMLEDKYDDRPASTGKGNPVTDVGLTGLALLAFEAQRNGPGTGEYGAQVASGINWLKSVQSDEGLYGEEVGNPTLYNHAIATMAMGEAYRMTERSPVLKPSLRNATNVILAAQNPYAAWRYKLEPNGGNDSSITGWMVFALKTAESGGLPVDKSAYDGAGMWFATMEDRNNGRVGYALGDDGGGPGSYPSRPAHLYDRYPAEKSEALTAVALLCRIFMTDSTEVKRWQDHPEYESLRKQADLVLAKRPKWDEEDGSIDMYFWYYGTFAMNQWGGKHWQQWEKALAGTLLPNQHRDDEHDNLFGSWDPVGAWGEEGGRVYSTAICALMLEVYYRYARVPGSTLNGSGRQDDRGRWGRSRSFPCSACAHWPPYWRFQRNEVQASQMKGSGYPIRGPGIRHKNVFRRRSRKKTIR